MHKFPWPDFLPPPIFIDLETFTDTHYSIKKMGSIPYIYDDRFFLQCLAYADPIERRNGVIWHDEDIEGYLYELSRHRTLVCHNTFFDGKVMKVHFDKSFDVMACTQAMGRMLLRHESPGFSLDAMYYTLFGTPFKTDAVEQLKGIREVPKDMRAMFGQYALTDVVAMVKIFIKLANRVPPGQWWQMHWTFRQHIEPLLRINTQACDQFQEQYQTESDELYAQFDAQHGDFSSAANFAVMLEKHGGMFDPLNGVGRPRPGQPSIPTTEGARGPRYDFSKKSESFISDVLESDDATIRELGTIRLRAASSSEAAQAKKLKEVALYDPRFCLGVQKSGCATHRISGSSDLCGINVLAMKRGSILRCALEAPRGYDLLALDMSAFELGICRFMSDDRPSMEILLQKHGDMYVEFAKVAYNNDALTKQDELERNTGKTSELQLQYNSGAGALRSKLLSVGIPVTMDEAEHLVHVFRYVKHKALTNYWKQFERYLIRMRRPMDPMPIKGAPFLSLEHEGIRLPSGLKLHFPDIKKSKVRYGDRWGTGWTYRKTIGKSFMRDGIYGGKLMQYCCQSLANCIIEEKKRRIEDEIGVRVTHEVYDDLTMAIPKSFGQSEIDAITQIAVDPVHWWPELPLKCEYGRGPTWGDCHKDTPVYGPLIH